MMDRIGLLLCGLALGIALTSAVNRSIEPEYGIELINCDLVKVTSNESGKVYYCTPEEIVEKLDLDNL